VLPRARAVEVGGGGRVTHTPGAAVEVNPRAAGSRARPGPPAVPPPTITRLYPHLDPDTPTIPEGSAEIPLDWRGVWIGLGVLASVLVGLALVLKRVKSKRHRVEV